MNHRAAVYAASGPYQMLDYLVNNNPAAVLAWLNQNATFEDSEVSVNELLDIAWKLAFSSGTPKEFVINMAANIPHNDHAEGWANIKNGNQ